MHRELIAFGTIFVLGIVAWFWPQKSYRPKLEPGESFLKAAFADEVSEQGTRTGRLCLTSSRLVYGIHLGYSVPIGSRGSGRFDDIEKVEWALNSINKVEDCSHEASNEQVKIILRDGHVCRFTMKSSSPGPKWAKAIEDARQARG